MALTLCWCSSISAKAAEVLKVDCGLDGQMVQAGFEEWSVSAQSGNVGVAKDFNAFEGVVSVSMLNADGSDTGLSARQRNRTTTGALGALVQDAFKNPGAAGLRLVLSNLKAGAYKLTMYHHDATSVHGTIDLFLTDAHATEQLAADEVRISTGSIDPTVTTSTINLRSDGVNEVYVRMVIGSDANNPEVWVNGFELETQLEDVLTITQQPRGAVVGVGGTATFSVAASTVLGKPVNYQWQRNGVNLPGATSAEYTTPAAAQADSGTRYRVIVTVPNSALTATSDEVLLRIIGPAGQTLPTVGSGTLVVHLKSDVGLTPDVDGNATTWEDVSGNGYIFTALRDPVKLGVGATGNPVVLFSGNSILKSDRPIQLFPAPDSGLTIFTAFSTVANGGQKFVVNWGIQSDGTRGNVELGYDIGNGAGEGNFGLHLGCGQATIADPGTILNNQFAIMSTLVKSTGVAPNNVEIYKNGIARGLSANGPGGCPPNHAGWLNPGEYKTGEATLDIGARDDTGGGSLGSFHNGDIGEVIVFQGSLSEADRQAVEAYLGERYGLTVTPPPVVLGITRAVVLSFPASAFNYILEGTDSLVEPVQWSPVTESRVLAGDIFKVTIESVGKQYYRLRKP